MAEHLVYEWLLPLAPWESPHTLQVVLASLSSQTLPAKCLIVSVDGILPEPLRQVLCDSSMPLRIIEAESWQGTGAVLARGVKACTAPWILRSDADDVSHPMRAATQLAYLALHPQLAVLGTQLSEQGSDGETCKIRHVPLSYSSIKRMMQWRNPINHPTVAFSREAVLASGNYRTCPAFEDWDLWLRMIKSNFKFANLDQSLVIAGVGEAHLARRHGWVYFHKERHFLVSCAHERLLSVPQVLLLMILRLPWRLLPSAWLGGLMDLLRLYLGSN